MFERAMDFDPNEQMIREQIIRRGVRDSSVLDAMRRVPREIFVPTALQEAAYDDSPLPLGQGQTISQPYIVAYMTSLLRLRGDERVLEIGAGCGYQTAILSHLAREIFSAELEHDLAEVARANLELLAITNVELRVGDGLSVFADRAPFDAILAAAAPEIVPESLVSMLGEGGRLVIPAGRQEAQSLWLIERRNGTVTRRQLDAVRFVPLR
jgi:protein-L-isoaspartate(D-aspartate) O-methyltransferase